MKCAECNLWWADYPDVPCSCHADPNWPAPCEYEDDYEPEEEWDEPSCSTCIHQGDFSLDDVACCNCCENYSFYEPREEN